MRRPTPNALSCGRPPIRTTPIRPNCCARSSLLMRPVAPPLQLPDRTIHPNVRLEMVRRSEMKQTQGLAMSVPGLDIDLGAEPVSTPGGGGTFFPSSVPQRLGSPLLLMGPV